MKSNGFTLIEILVALAILAIALTAIYSASLDDTRTANYIQTKTQAHWLARQLLVETQLKIANGSPIPAKQQTTQRYGDKTWYTTTTLTTTRYPHVSEINVSISDEKTATAITELRGYVGVYNE